MEDKPDALLKAKRRVLAALIAPSWPGLTPEAKDVWTRICPELLELVTDDTKPAH